MGRTTKALAGGVLAAAVTLLASPGAVTAPQRLVPTAATATTPVVTISAVGDTILGNTPTLPAHPVRYFRAVRPTMTNADIVFANLEGTLTNATASKCGAGSSGCYAFRNPPSYAGALARVGIDVVSNGNNHSHDFGTQGVQDTLAALNHAGVRHSGLPGQIAYTRAHGIRTAFVSFAPYASTANMLNLDAAAALVRKAAAHARLVTVYMHAGAEGSNAQHVTGHEEYYLGEDRGNPRRFAHRMVRAGAELVIGSGPHVLRGMEFYRGRLIAYSLGNFANYHNFNTSGVLALSAMLRVTLGPGGGFRGGHLTSVRLVDAGRPVLQRGSLTMVRSLSQQDFGTHAARLSKTGIIRPPV
jgi:poly-gamma-glutamate capsule biosynthesis protein CapA/YwtB (metallophosphatase superfamily)